MEVEILSLSVVSVIDVYLVIFSIEFVGLGYVGGLFLYL